LLGEDIFDTDHPLLKKLTKISHQPEANSDSDNFELIFHFAPNEWFENDVLKVKFFMLDGGQDPEKMEATEIKWKEGKNITKKKIQKKQKNKKTGKTRTVEKEVDADSFFNLFRTISGPAGGDDEGDDEEGGDENMERLNINTDIALTIQEEIIPYHLEYYLGLRKGDYDDMGGFGEEGEDDEDDDDEEDAKVKFEF
jgi:nucleosome assembly protein 1-like 1